MTVELEQRTAVPIERSLLLKAAWDRARGSAKYGDLGEFTDGSFRDLRVTSKDDLKTDPWGYVAVGLDDALKYYETTGTSGVVTPTPRTRDDLEFNVRAVSAGWSRIIGPGDRVLSLLPSDVVPVGDLITSVMETIGALCTKAYPYAQGVSGWDRVLPLWQRIAPTVVFAAPGVLRELTKFAEARGVLSALTKSVHTVMLLGEVSGRALRNRLGSIWETNVLDASYGSTESGTLATGCDHGFLHALVGSHHFEIKSDDGSLHDAFGPGHCPDSGSLVVTPFHAYARPLLRYELGDVVSVGAICDCGDERPCISVVGRETDAIQLGGGAIMIADLEQHVYSLTSAIGYLIEVDDRDAPTKARILLERLTSGQDRDVEAKEAARLTGALRSETMTGDVRCVWLNSLPQATKSGGSQKNWKATNVRVGEW